MESKMATTKIDFSDFWLKNEDSDDYYKKIIHQNGYKIACNYHVAVVLRENYDKELEFVSHDGDLDYDIKFHNTINITSIISRHKLSEKFRKYQFHIKIGDFWFSEYNFELILKYSKLFKNDEFELRIVNWCRTILFFQNKTQDKFIMIRNSYL